MDDAAALPTCPSKNKSRSSLLHENKGEGRQLSTLSQDTGHFERSRSAIGRMADDSAADAGYCLNIPLNTPEEWGL